MKKINQKNQNLSFQAYLIGAPKGNDDQNQNKQNNTSVDQRFDSVVVVKTSDGFGSGFYIESNKVVTNYLDEGYKNVTVSDSKGNDTSARVLKIDKKRDLALLEVNRSGNPVQLSNDPIYSGMKVDILMV